MRAPFAKRWEERAKHCSGCWFDTSGADGTTCPRCARDSALHESWTTDGQWSIWPLVGIGAGIAAAVPPLLMLMLGWIISRLQNDSDPTPAVIGLIGVKLIGLAILLALVTVAMRRTRRYWNNFARIVAVTIPFYLIGLASSELSKWLLLPSIGP
ncbi:MAG TPA: hypothetical protein DEB06_04030 [Phycisphaerales bacterium]|nr:hypothetical protein [Phycisphaerales bacterium]